MLIRLLDILQDIADSAKAVQESIQQLKTIDPTILGGELDSTKAVPNTCSAPQLFQQEQENIFPAAKRQKLQTAPLM